MSDFEKIILIIGDKEQCLVKHLENEIHIILNDFGMVFDNGGAYQYSFNFKE